MKWTGTSTSITRSERAEVPSLLRGKAYGPAFCVRLIFLTLICFLSASPASAQNREQDSGNLTFTLPQIPAGIKGATERALHLSLSYWEGLDVRGEIGGRDSLNFETAYADFLTLLPLIESDEDLREVALSSARILSGSGLLDYFMDLSLAYLLDGSSEMKDGRIFSLIAGPILTSSYTHSLEELTLERTRFNLESVLRNRVGSPALDFALTGRDGKTGTLYEHLGKKTLLVFFDFDCRNCRSLLLGLDEDKDLKALIHKGVLQVMAVYKSADMETWEKEKDLLSTDFSLFREDGVIDRDHLYDIPSLPSLYLLSGDGTVILSRASLKDVREYLSKDLN